MLLLHTSKLLRVALLSKGLVGQSQVMPKIKQVIISVKVENNYDLINNLSLLVSLTGQTPKSVLINRKLGATLPHVVLSQPKLNSYFGAVLTFVIQRLTDKTVANSFRAASNKLTFTFKSTDALSAEMHKLWKWLGSEVGLFTLQVTFVTNCHADELNEALLRGYNLPVVLNK